MKRREKGVKLAFSVSSCQNVSLGLHVTAGPCTPSSMFLEPKEAGEELGSTRHGALVGCGSM